MNLLNINFNILIEKFTIFSRRRSKEEDLDSFEILKEDVEEHPFELDILNMFIFVIDEDLKFLYTSSYPPFLKKKKLSHYEYITNLFPPKIISFYVKLILRKEVRAKRKILTKINGKFYLVIVKPFLERTGSSTIIIHVPFSNISNVQEILKDDSS